MALSDAQIDRFSRQIILPQIGGVGQERLLQSSVAVAGDGELATITALYLAGAGVGHIALVGLDLQRVSAELADLNGEIEIAIVREALADARSDVMVACNLPLAELNPAAALGRPLVAGGADGHWGWLVVAEPGGACASCAARQAARAGTGGRCPLSSATAGVVGSLISLAVLKRLLGLHQPASREWLQFDAAGSTLTAHPVARAADCPVCTVA